MRSRTIFLSLLCVPVLYSAGKIGVTERKMDEIFGSASPPEASRQLSSAIDNVVADMGRASQDASGEGGSNQHFMTAVEGFEPPTPSTTLLPTRSPKRRTAAPVIPDVVVEQADYTKPPTISPALRLTGRNASGITYIVLAGSHSMGKASMDKAAQSLCALLHIARSDLALKRVGGSSPSWTVLQVVITRGTEGPYDALRLVQKLSTAGGMSNIGPWEILVATLEPYGALPHSDVTTMTEPLALVHSSIRRIWSGWLSHPSDWRQLHMLRVGLNALDLAMKKMNGIRRIRLGKGSQHGGELPSMIVGAGSTGTMRLLQAPRPWPGFELMKRGLNNLKKLVQCEEEDDCESNAKRNPGPPVRGALRQVAAGIIFAVNEIQPLGTIKRLLRMRMVKKELTGKIQQAHTPSTTVAASALSTRSPHHAPAAPFQPLPAVSRPHVPIKRATFLFEMVQEQLEKVASFEKKIFDLQSLRRYVTKLTKLFDKSAWRTMIHALRTDEALLEKKIRAIGHTDSRRANWFQPIFSSAKLQTEAVEAVDALSSSLQGLANAASERGGDSTWMCSLHMGLTCKEVRNYASLIGHSTSRSHCKQSCENARSHGCLYRNQRCYFGWKKDMPCSPVTPYPGTPYPKSYNAGACGAVYQKHSCIVTAWSRWGVCWGKCGGGKQFRMRRIETLPLNRGDACPKLLDVRKCQLDLGCLATQAPSFTPTRSPTAFPTRHPTTAGPTLRPTHKPSRQPTTGVPSQHITPHPSTVQPTYRPSSSTSSPTTASPTSVPMRRVMRLSAEHGESTSGGGGTAMNRGCLECSGFSFTNCQRPERFSKHTRFSDDLIAVAFVHASSSKACCSACHDVSSCDQWRFSSWRGSCFFFSYRNGRHHVRSSLSQKAQDEAHRESLCVRTPAGAKHGNDARLHAQLASTAASTAPSVMPLAGENRKSRTFVGPHEPARTSGA